MKSVIKSLYPEACERIANGKQKFILSKSAPKEVPFKGHIYCTKAGEKFVHGGIEEKQVLFFNPDTKEYKFDYSFELICCKNKYSKDNFLSGKVIGEFECNKIVKLRREFCPHPELGYSLSDNCGDEWWGWDDEELEIDFSLEELNACAGKRNILYAWCISEVKIYDTPKALSEFKKICAIKNKDCANCEFYSDYSGTCINYLTRPPANWCYVET